MMLTPSIELLLGFTLPVRTKKIKKSVISLLKDLQVWDEVHNRLKNVSDLMLMLRNPYPETMVFVDRYKPILQLSESLNYHNLQKTEKTLRSELAINFIRRSVNAYDTNFSLVSSLAKSKTSLSIYKDAFFDHGGEEFLTKTYLAVDEDEVMVVFVLLLLIIESQERIFQSEKDMEDNQSLFDVLSKEMDHRLHIEEQPKESEEIHFSEDTKETEKKGMAIFSEPIDTSPTELPLEYTETLEEGYSLYDLLRFDASQKFTLDTFEFDPEKLYICPNSGELTNLPILKDGDIVSPLVNAVEREVDTAQENHFEPKETVRDKIQFLVKTLSIPEASAREALKNSKQDKWVALVRIVDATAQKFCEPPTEAFPQLPASRRVQYGGIRSPPKSNSYRFDENSEEAKELMAIYHSNDDFQKINVSFLEYCLVYYKGNYMKVIELALQMLEDKAEESLQAVINEPLSTLPSTFTEPERSASPEGPYYLQKAAEGKYRSPVDSIKASKPISTRRTTRSIAPVPNLLDLHNHAPDDALIKATQTLNSWWSEELQERENEGLFHKYHSVIQFNDPLTIITGRGIHSMAGPVIRPKVEKLLKRENYIYSEIKPGFIVTGKRK